MASYVVRSGDSLSRIARDVLGNMARWPDLARLNAIESPYTIYPGQVLELPTDVTPRQAQPVTSPAPASSNVTARAWWKNPWVWFLAAGILALAALPAVRRPRRHRRV